MKFFSITLMMFLINIAASIINVAALFDNYNGIQPQQGWIDEASAVSTKNEEYFQSAATQETSNSFGFGDFVKGLWLFVSNFAKGVIAPYYLLKQFGMPLQIAVYIASTMYL